MLRPPEVFLIAETRRLQLENPITLCEEDIPERR
jgi:hypothetical protein